MGETLQQIVRLIDAPSWRSRLGLSLISNFSSERFETFFAPPSCSPFPLLCSIVVCPFIVKCVFFHHETCFLSSWNMLSFIMKCVSFYHEMRFLSSWNVFSFIMKCVSFHRESCFLSSWNALSFHHETRFLSSKSGISPKRTDISPKITEFFGKTTDISSKKTDIFGKISLVFLPSTAKRVAPSFFLLAQLPKARGLLPFPHENERINRIYAIIMREN